ncbi:MAG: 50S ribosomal protein L20 [Candidatus Spechtbacteria bacterium RIFCSPHIGHO2_02_FULL_43_15b]|uniref:Large ribosomal subunit protein bL20 n=1 Tax=Candidatus Spechtbacteria bacterium RIFCSPHIGHO2_01_FULL_43_30 TaxID=1802158 RepID=A0A1G2H5T3_9BACT|nr:MAG: 50S ribosomal protein L20 [Candidatus Spechtbacteria bacterium RIFCSPHIGHO2_01_FULL_43_30]OGZ58605.1 MAG: 50S ribosomal protein L20 [Candidatus Spechtbacteria bacterium RIFCSPHIGHO2_02_FULL_43_15b]
MRIKRGRVRAKKRKRLLMHSKGFMWRRKNVYRLAREAVHHAWASMFVGRKQKKRNFRQLWNIQINAASRQNGLSYSKLIHGLKKNNVEVDRKVLAKLAQDEPEVFKNLVETAKK